MKKVIFSLAILMVMILTGCGGGGSSASSSSSTSEEISPVKNTATQNTIAFSLPDVPQIPSGN